MEGNPKQLIVERIKNATNILVTVSSNPSVDELAAALGFTLMLNKMDKHATAVFSGAIPPAINFLEPAKTFENTVDSLRDFIIALDKEKADRLRYKVEDDVVRIFITPYRTTITEADLNFSQGDFNVELIVALGVEKKEDLDIAISAHGRILHDATVVTINSHDEKSTLGSIDWSDAGASSLCEMLMSLSEALQSGLLDEQIASSLLTGIVAATERFSNPHTTPKVMTMAAQLMAAGANQQLIAAKLEEGHALGAVNPVATDNVADLKEGDSAKLSTIEPLAPAPVASTNGEMRVDHDSAVEVATELAVEAEEDRAEEQAQDELSALTQLPVSVPSVSSLQKDLEAVTQEAASATNTPSEPAVESNTEPLVGKAKVSDWRGKIIEPPTLGGTLSATSSEAEEANFEEERSQRNHTILSHDGADAGMQSINARENDDTETPAVDLFAEPLSYEELPTSSEKRVIAPIEHTEHPVSAVPPAYTIADLEAQAHRAEVMPTPDAPNMVDDARAAVDAALGASTAPAPQVPTLQSSPAFPQPAYNALPPPPPMPDFSSLPPLPPLPGEPQFPPQTPPASPQFPQQPPEAPASNDPGQFKIPGQ
ncbi:hypothetical protein H7Y40_01855 [Pedobacter sp.]|nr:hypothetical protein [Candidatus Saccharibacteria bacterium]